MRYGYIRVSIDGYSKNQQKLFLEKHQIDKYIFEDNSLKMDSGNQLLNLINHLILKHYNLYFLYHQTSRQTEI